MERIENWLVDKSDENDKKIFFIIPTNNIYPCQRLKLRLKGCTLLCNNLEINNNAIIIFYDNSIEINGVREGHDGRIPFRKINFDNPNHNISNLMQFKIIIENKIPTIICLTAPLGGTPTSFVIKEKEIILEEGHVRKKCLL